MPLIFHLDLDAFFVSVERILNPQLNGKIVIVGDSPTGRGVVAACSYEARKYGVHSAMPIREAYKRCPQGEFIKGHHTEYSRFSKLVGSLLKDIFPKIQQASVDEFYLDALGISKNYGGVLELATFTQMKILKELKLPSSIGIASNKTIAKIASDFRKPLGVTYVLEGKEKSFLSSLPLEVIPGVGKVMIKNLNSKGFYKIRDISEISVDYLTASFGKSGIDLWDKANGYGSSILNSNQQQKSISKETTFGEDILDTDILLKVLHTLCGKVCHTLREQELMTSCVSLKLRYNDFITNVRSKTIELTDDDRTIFECVRELFNKTYTRRVSVRLVGINLSKFSQSGEQINLFEDEAEKRKNLLEVVNNIRGKYGYSMINLGANEISMRIKKRI